LIVVKAPTAPPRNNCDLSGLLRYNHASVTRSITIVGIVWTILIGAIAGAVAKFLLPGPNAPQGFILTTILGIVGAFVMTVIGQVLGWYQAGEGAGLIGAIVGAVIVLVAWGAFTRRRA
jgi:uncharacterized membrane protein YeaQ/YmgE (transglycosylase-associated protein family)